MNYKNTVFNDVIVQGDIIEYDITAAGINVMYAEGIISKGLYDYWMSLPKEIRNIKAGIHIGDNGLQPKKEKALNKYIDMFLKENHVEENDIMEIASDAIWLFNIKSIKTRKFKNVEFRADRTASIMICWNNFKFYMDSWNGEFFVRGYREFTPFVARIKELLGLIENGTDQKTMYKFLHNFKMSIVYEECKFINEEKSLEFVDWLLDQLIK